jgi:IS5 family transposase
MVMDAQTKQIISIHIEKGACHDFHLYKKTKLRMHPNIKQKADSGYQGAQHSHKNTDLPKKGSKNKPLTKEQRRENRILAKVRVCIEHKNAQLKVFKLAKNHYRSHTRFGLRITLIATFVNANLY